MSKTPILKKFIKGAPYSRYRAQRGNILGPSEWTKSVIQQTKNLPPVNGSCEMRVVFVLSENKYPTNLPYGPDLDNYIKRFQDALNETIFAKIPGKDSCVTKLYAEKQKVRNDEQSGVMLEIYNL